MTSRILLLLPALMGFLLVVALSCGRLRYCRHQVFNLFLGTGTGIGLASECYFLGLASGTAFWFEFLLFAAVVAAIALYRRATRCFFCERSIPVSGNRPLTRYLACVFGLLLSLELVVFAWVSARTPLGGWDAWAIWNLHAHFLYRGGPSGWRDGFTELLDWSHPDYPLLLPAFIARGWQLLGRETIAVPIGLACFFTFGCAGLIASSLAALRDARQGLLAGIALAATPMLYVQGAMQCADVPVAFFRIASLAALALADRFDSRGFAVLAGITAALDAWTKNEGLLWLGAFLLARIAVTRRFWPALLAGVLPVLGPIVYFKARVATSSDIFGAAGRTGMLARITDPARYILIAREALRHAWNFGPLLFSAFAILALYLAVAGRERNTPHRALLRTGALASLLTVLGYFGIYLVRPLDLAWLLDTSADRLLVQLWPTIVFLVFLAARAPTQTQHQEQRSADREIMLPGVPGLHHPVPL